MMHYLEQCVLRHLPHLAGGMRITPVHTGKFNDSFFVDAEDARLVLRIAPPRDSVFCFYEREMMRQEPRLHRLLREQTNVPVPEVLAFDGSLEIIDRDFLIMERMPGKPLIHCPGIDHDAIYRAVGRCLAEVHGLTRNAFGYLGEHQPMAPQPSWLEAFVVMWRMLVMDVAGLGCYTAHETDTMLERLTRHLDLFDRDVPASLLHMDIWDQNILVNEGALSAILDWDRALWGDPEIEFAVLDYCGVSTPAFWEGYGKPRDQSPEALLRQRFYLLYELQKYIVIRHGRHNDPAAAEQYKQEVMAIAAEIP